VLASKALICRPRAVIAVAHNNSAMNIMFICSVNAFINQLFSAVTTYKRVVVHALNEHDPVT
jgi:hypothetical protein